MSNDAMRKRMNMFFRRWEALLRQTTMHSDESMTEPKPR